MMKDINYNFVKKYYFSILRTLAVNSELKHRSYNEIVKMWEFYDIEFSNLTNIFNTINKFTHWHNILIAPQDSVAVLFKSYECTLLTTEVILELEYVYHIHWEKNIESLKDCVDLIRFSNCRSSGEPG